MEAVLRLRYYLLVFVFILTIFYVLPFGISLEPDSYFHFAISKLTFEQGLVRTLPQADNLGWSEYFPDKEFLFHQFTALGYGLGGIVGVHIACLVMASSIFMMILVNCEQFCSRTKALIISFLVVSNFHFADRLFLVRPHLGGILFFLVILLGLIKNNNKILAIGSLLFPLFYHAFFIPLMILGIFGLIEKGKNAKFLLLFGVLPLFLGILINPYFPSNIVLTWEVIKIAFSANFAQNPGQEAEQLSFFDTLNRSGPYLVMTLALLTQIKEIYKNKQVTALLVGVVAFFILYFISPRSIEYLVPTLAILLCAFLPIIEKKISFFFPVLCTFLVAINIQYLGFFVSPDPFWSSRAAEMEILVKQLPEKPSLKVFNCEWESGSYILYFRQNLKFVDLLDPNFIYLQSKELGELRDKMVKFPNPHTHSTLVDIFKADYLMCFNPNFLKIVENDPRFLKVGESASPPVTKIFKILKN